MNTAHGHSVQLAPSSGELDDLDLITTGALPQVTGFGQPQTGITLQVPEPAAATLSRGSMLELVDPEGVPLAMMRVQDIYAGAAGSVGLVGPVQGLVRREGRVFDHLYLSPKQVRADIAADAVTVACARPMAQHDLDRVMAVASGRAVVLLALVGDGRPEGVSATGLIRACLAAARLIPNARVVAVPLARREIADREVWDRVVTAYAPSEVLEIDGDGPLAGTVADVVRSDRPIGTDRGMVLFFTGLSGSGKSTVARGVRDALVEDGHRTVTLLDGDVVRRNLSAGLTFSREDRETNIRRIGWVAAEIARHGGAAICSPIAPFASTRAAVREMVEATGAAYLLVHVSTPLEECERRDRKGLYANARRGDIPDFTGISSPYEAPDDARLTVDTTGRPVADVVDEVLDLLARDGLVRLDPSPADGRAHG